MIKHIRMKNFKCFSDQKFELGSLTILSGLNGLGKSSTLQALLLLRQSFQQSLLPNIGLALNGDFANFGTGKDALFDGAEIGEIEFDILFLDGQSAKWEFKYESDIDVLPLISCDVSSNIYKTSLFNDNFIYIEVERTGPRRFFEMSAFKVKHHRQMGKKGEYASHFLSVFALDKLPNDCVVHPKVKKQNLKDQVEAWMQEIRPGIQLHLESHPNMDLLNLTYSFIQERDITSIFRSTNVGFGITYTLSIIIAIISAKPNSLVLLENPEAHIHPRGQAKLGELIALASSGGVQIIVETHSDHLINGIKMAMNNKKIEPKDIKIHFFELSDEKNNNQIEIFSPDINSDFRIGRWPFGFFLSEEDSIAFIDALDNPPSPNQALINAAKQYKEKNGKK